MGSDPELPSFNCSQRSLKDGQKAPLCSGLQHGVCPCLEQKMEEWTLPHFVVKVAPCPLTFIFGFFRLRTDFSFSTVTVPYLQT